MLARLVTLAWLGCADAPPPPTAREQAEAAAVVQAQRAPPPPSPPSGGEGVEVAFVWENIGSLHQGFFTDADAVKRLSTALAPALRSPARVTVRYDELERQGSIRLQLGSGALRTPLEASEAGVDLLALRPIAMAMAAYRDAIADRYDVRVRNFVVGLAFSGGAHDCIVGLAGPLPHDGSVLSPCVQISGELLCGEPEGALVRFPEQASLVAACFR